MQTSQHNRMSMDNSEGERQYQYRWQAQVTAWTNGFYRALALVPIPPSLPLFMHGCGG